MKACIARKTRRYDFPDRKAVLASHTHDLTELVKAAGLGQELDRDLAGDPALRANWSVVKDWNESSRYTSHTATEARDLVACLAGRHGVLAWARRRW